MSNLNLRSITNHFQDVHLASLASWRQADEISPRDHGGPYVVIQQGYDPTDPRMTPDEFVLGRSGKWLSLRHFFRMPVPERRAEFVFGTAGEIMHLMSELPTKVSILGQPGGEAAATPSPEGDEMAEALRSRHSHAPGKTS